MIKRKLSRKKQNPAIGLLLVFAVFFGMSFKCGRDNNTSTDADYNDGKILIGRYVNTIQGINSFTFSADKTFKRGGASSGSYRGGDYVTGKTDSGTYHIKGNVLTLQYDDGRTERLKIQINIGESGTPQSPYQLFINNVSYINSD
ncbi:MAG: lipocalin family protein [Acidobacteriota bacterium]|nr:lipocalin family protein [Acidobacteriota bacterium]